MNSEEIYRDWVQTHQTTKSSPEFAKAVMNRIDQIDSHRYNAWSKRLEIIAESSWARAAGIAVAAALGLGRILLTLHILSFG